MITINTWTGTPLYKSATALTIREAVAQARSECADLGSANLSGADLGSANLSSADLSSADLSGAKGLLNSLDWFRKNFKRTKDGVVVYKVIGSRRGTDYAFPQSWDVKPGAIWAENVNPCPTTGCGCGINVATLKWCKQQQGCSDIWACLIRWHWLVSVVVPYNTDGKIRAAKLQLIRKVK